MLLRAWILVSCLSLIGCSGNETSRCGAAEACAAGSICLDDVCRALCNQHSECVAGEVCDAGVCRTQGAGGCERDADCEAPLICELSTRACVPANPSVLPPEVTQLDGTGTADDDPTHGGHHLVDRVVIRGNHLAEATVGMVGVNPARPFELLELCEAPTANELVVRLPDGIAAGEYRLTVSNQAGSCDASVTLLQGEQGEQGPAGPGADGSLFVDIDGDAMTGELTVAAPVGIGTTTPRASLDVETVGTAALTGLVTAGSGFTVVTGTGTQFTAELNPGDTFYVAGAAYVVASIESDVSLTLSTATTAGFADATAATDTDSMRIAGSDGTTRLLLDKSGNLNLFGPLVCDGCVATQEIAPDAVTSTELATDSVDSNELVNGSVTTAKIDNGAVTNAKLSCSCGTCFNFGTSNCDGGWLRMCTPAGWVNMFRDYSCSP